MPEYIAVIHKDEGSDYSLYFPDFPGCYSAGSTMEEARTMAFDALAGHVEILIEDGATIPKPSTLDAVACAKENAGAVAFFAIPAFTHKPKVERKNISALDVEWEIISRAAKNDGSTRSAFMVTASLEKANSNTH